MRELQNSGEGDGLVPALDASNLVPVIATLLRQLLLREPPFKSQLSHLFAEQNQCAGHAI